MPLHQEALAIETGIIVHLAAGGYSLCLSPKSCAIQLYKTKRACEADTPDSLLPRNKDSVSSVNIELQELCCGQKQVCLVVCKSIGDEAWDAPAEHACCCITSQLYLAHRASCLLNL